MDALGQGVYFLFKGERLVYIGKSNSIYARIGQHCVSSKDFDSWEYYEAKDYTDIELGSLEATLISNFCPPYNGTHAHGDEITYTTKNQYMKHIRGLIKDFEEEHLITTENTVTRCKNCAYWNAVDRVRVGGRTMQYTNHVHCPMWRALPNAQKNGFPLESDGCSRGVSKTDGGCRDKTNRKDRADLMFEGDISDVDLSLYEKESRIQGAWKIYSRWRNDGEARFEEEDKKATIALGKIMREVVGHGNGNEEDSAALA